MVADTVISLFFLFFGIGLLMKQLKHFWCCSCCRCCTKKQPHNIFIGIFTKSIKFSPYRSFAFEFPHEQKNRDENVTQNIPKLEWKIKNWNICAVYTILWILPFNWSCRCFISFHFIDCTILIDQQQQHYIFNCTVCVCVLCASIK